MTKTNRLFSLIFLTVLVSGCATTFPKTMPEDFGVRYDYSAGMVANYKTINLGLGVCSVESKQDGISTDYTFKVTREKLELLYQELLANKSFTLKSTTKTVYDRGGVAIKYKIDGNTYTTSNSGINFIVKGDLDRFTKAVNLIVLFANEYAP